MMRRFELNLSHDGIGGRVAVGGAFTLAMVAAGVILVLSLLLAIGLQGGG